MKTSIQIRNAIHSDALGIAKVHVKAWQETYPGMIPQNYLDSLKVEQRFELWDRSLKVESERELTWVALNEQQEVIGFICGGAARKPELGLESELYAIYLLKAYQGKGIGRKLFNELCRKLKAQSYKSMYLWVIEDSPTCKKYEALGGVKTEHMTDDDIDGELVREVVYSFQI